MIVRLWHGRTNISKADEYAEFMKERAAPDYGSIDGLKKLYFLRRIDGDAAHFLLVTLWDSMESVKKSGKRLWAYSILDTGGYIYGDRCVVVLIFGIFGLHVDKHLKNE